MKILFYLGYLGIFVWAIVPFRQFRKKYFFYFLPWVSADVITLAARFIFHSKTNFFYAPFAFLALAGLLDIKFIRKNWIVMSVIFLAVCFISLEKNVMEIPDIQKVGISLSIIHFFILFIFLKKLIISFAEDNLIDIFIIVLLFYEITIIAKFLNYLTGFTNNYIYFIITSVFEILFGLFFILFKSDDKRLVFQLK